MITDLQNQLLPIETEWMLSVSVSSICLSLQEGGDVFVEFDAAYLPARSSNQYPFGELDIKRVKVRFAQSQWCRTFPLVDRLGIEGKGFDLSRTTRLSVDGLEEDLTRFRAQWAHGRLCPDSKFYEVANSAWIADQNASRFGLRHFLLKGVDIVVELLALDWSECDTRR